MVTQAIPPARVKQETPDYRLDIDGWEFAVTRMPIINCKKGCYGRGWTGRHEQTGRPIVCKCVGYWELFHEPKGGTEKE